MYLTTASRIFSGEFVSYLRKIMPVFVWHFLSNKMTACEWTVKSVDTSYVISSYRKLSNRVICSRL